MLICPNCKSQKFFSGIQVAGEIDFQEDVFIFTSSKNETQQVGNGAIKVQCANCGTIYDNIKDENVLDAMLHPTVKCSKCGKEFKQDELDENGECIICRAKNIIPGFDSLDGADTFTLLKALAEVTIENSKLANKQKSIEERLERAEQLENASNETSSEAPKKRRGRPKKDAETNENVTVEEVDIDNQNEENDLEISEEIAPELPSSLNDISNAINQPEE